MPEAEKLGAQERAEYARRVKDLVRERVEQAKAEGKPIDPARIAEETRMRIQEERAAAEKAKAGQPTVRGPPEQTTKSVAEDQRFAELEKKANDKAKPEDQIKLSDEQKEGIRKALDKTRARKGQGDMTDEEGNLTKKVQDDIKKILAENGFKDRPDVVDKLLKEGVFGDERFTDVRGIRPSQTGVGYKQIAEQVEDFKREFDLHRKANGDFYKEFEKLPKDKADAESLAKWLREEKYKNLGAIEAYITPDGEIMVTDSHHRGSALLEFIKELKAKGVSEENLPKLKINVKGDFRGRPGGWTEFARRLKLEKEKGWFGKKGEAEYKGKISKYMVEDGMTREQAEGRALKEAFDNLPKDFASLPNDPMRSAVGVSFFRAGFESGIYQDYFEFKVYEYLEGRNPPVTLETLRARVKAHTGREVPLDGAEVDPDVIWELRQEMLTDGFADAILRDLSRLKGSEAKRVEMMEFANKFIEAAREINDVEGQLRGKVTDKVLIKFRKLKSKQRTLEKFNEIYAEEYGKGLDLGPNADPAVKDPIKNWIERLAKSDSLKDDLKK